jgi:IS605 OrfB family transposase
MQAVSRSKKTLHRGVIKPSQLGISVKTKQDPKTIDQVRVVPKNGFYVVEVVYEKAITKADVDPSFCVGIDLGVTNLAAIASNREGWVPRLVNGRPLKARNQWYNKRLKALKLKLPKDDLDRVTKQMERITNKRNRQIDYYLHTASKRIIDFLAKEGVGTIIVGKNPLWKQEVNRGRHNNQNFVCIPHARFIDMVTYKAELVGIKVIVTEESYTSKASFLDLDDIPVYKPDDEEHVFSGKRVKRGLYRAKDGTAINADVQGAYNMIRKRRPNAFSEAKGVAGYVVHPVRLAV